MSILRIAFELFVLYLLYKVIFDFIIPVYNTTKQVKQKVGEMQQRMNDQMHQQQQQQQSFNQFSEKQNSKPRPSKEDYIEFEEVK